MRKYGRTYHLPISPGVMSDDKIMRDLSGLNGAQEVVFTEKMDGENTTIHVAGLDIEAQEGFVVRDADAFLEQDMATRMGKYVRAGHVQSEVHWRHAQIVKNGLKA